MMGLLQSDVCGLFPCSFSALKALQRLLYDFIMLIPSESFERFDRFYISVCVCTRV